MGEMGEMEKKFNVDRSHPKSQIGLSQPESMASSPSSSSLQRRERVVASAPAKIIIFGEHAVVHGKKAVAAVVDLRTFVEILPAEDDRVTVEFQKPKQRTVSWPVSEIRGLAEKAGIEKPLGRDYESESVQTAVDRLNTLIEEHLPDVEASAEQIIQVSSRVFLFLYIIFCAGREAISVKIRSEIPVGAGLGSSASYCASLVTGLKNYFAEVPVIPAQATLKPDDLELINHWAFQGERVIHGTPSGVDNTCSVYGGGLKFQKGEPNHFLKNFPPLHVLITDTRVERNTKKMVEGVHQMLLELPGPTAAIMNAMDECCKCMLDLLEKDVNEVVTSELPEIPLESSVLSSSDGDEAEEDPEADLLPGALPMEDDGAEDSGRETEVEEDGVIKYDAERQLSRAQNLVNSPLKVPPAPPRQNFDLALRITELVHMTHCMLRALRVSHQSIESVINEAQKYDLPSKLTGAGGGGCVVSFLPYSTPDESQAGFKAAVESLGFQCFNSLVGQDGVLLHNTLDVVALMEERERGRNIVLSRRGRRMSLVQNRSRQNSIDS